MTGQVAPDIGVRHRKLALFRKFLPRGIHFTKLWRAREGELKGGAGKRPPRATRGPETGGVPPVAGFQSDVKIHYSAGE